MRTLAITLALLAGLLFLPAASAHADPLVCVDPGPTHVGPYVIDLPEVCVL